MYSVWPLYVVQILAVFLIWSYALVSIRKTKSNRRINESANKGMILKEIYSMARYRMIHDLNNAVQKLHLLSLEKYRTNPELFNVTLTMMCNEIRNIYVEDIFESPTVISVPTIISNLSHVIKDGNCEVHMCIDEGSYIIGNNNIVYSTIKNLVINSIEAAQARDLKCNIIIVQHSNHIIITDSSGGFDLDMKGSFLKTITDPSIVDLFGFKVTVHNECEGTVVNLNFV